MASVFPSEIALGQGVVEIYTVPGSASPTCLGPPHELGPAQCTDMAQDPGSRGGTLRAEDVPWKCWIWGYPSDLKWDKPIGKPDQGPRRTLRKGSHHNTYATLYCVLTVCYFKHIVPSHLQGRLQVGVIIII